jgi:RNA polymerase sigma factor (TIGR02999 family)
MSDVTQILDRIQGGDPAAAEQLLPLVYDELRNLAAQKLAQENPGQTLQATALVHEAYLRLVNPGAPERGSSPPNWDSRRHFFAAAAEAMRRILIDNARRKSRVRHGGKRNRIDLEDAHLVIDQPAEDLLAIDEALEQLAKIDGEAANLVKLRFFAGMTSEEAAEALGIPARTAYRSWSFARAWLYRRLYPEDEAPSAPAEKP